MRAAATSPSRFPRSEELRRANPVFNANRLKLGVFGLNSVGCAQTLDPDAFNPDWDRSLRAAQTADAAGFEAIVPYARWKSFVPTDVHHRSSRVMECFIWAGAVAACTRKAAVFATCHVPVFHPVLAAKQGATVDQIAQGRFGLNIVAGWYQRELGMFGVDLGEHERRYEQAAEWSEVLRRTWTEPDEIDYDGDFYSVRGAYFEPKPAQSPMPPIMNAGSSARGREFAARFADLAFVMFGGGDAAAIRPAVQEYRALAAGYGREIQIWTPAYVIHGDREEDARREVDRLVARGDYVAADAFIGGMVETASNLPEDVLRTIRHRIVEGGGGFPLIGTTETIVDRLAQLADAGVDGVLLSWVRYEEGLDQFASEIIPALINRGLREPA